MKKGIWIVLVLLLAAPLQAASPFKTQMDQWNQAAIKLQSGLLRGNFVEISEAAWAINRAPALDQQLVSRLKSQLEDKDFKDLSKFDRYVRITAEGLAKKAGQNDLRGALVEQGKLLAACVQCHDLFKIKVLKALQ